MNLLNEVNDLKELSKFIDGINKNINEIDNEIKKKSSKQIDNKKSIKENKTKEIYGQTKTPVLLKSNYNNYFSDNEPFDNNNLSEKENKFHSNKSSTISPEIIRNLKEIIDKTSQDILNKKQLWNNESNKINNNLRHSFPSIGIIDNNVNISNNNNNNCSINNHTKNNNINNNCQIKKNSNVDNSFNLSNKCIIINTNKNINLKNEERKKPRNLKKIIGMGNYLASVNSKLNKTTLNPLYKKENKENKIKNIRKLKLHTIHNSNHNSPFYLDKKKKTGRTNNSFTLNKTMPYIIRDKNKINLKTMSNISNTGINTISSYQRNFGKRSSVIKQKIVKENFNKISEFKVTKKENIDNIFSLVEQINSLSNCKYIYHKKNPEKKMIYVNRLNETKNASFIQKKWREYYIKKNIINKFKIEKSKNQMNEIDLLQLGKLSLFSDLLKNNKYFKEMIIYMNKVTELYKKCLTNKKFNEVKNILLNKNPNDKTIYSKIINSHIKETKMTKPKTTRK